MAQAREDDFRNNNNNNNANSANIDGQETKNANDAGEVFTKAKMVRLNLGKSVSMATDRASTATGPGGGFL